MHDWEQPSALLLQRHGRGQNADAVTSPAEGEDNIMRAAVQQDVRANIGRLAGAFKPLAGAEAAAQCKQRPSREARDLDLAMLSEGVSARDGGHDMDRIERAPHEAIISRRDIGDIDLCPFETRDEARPAILDDMHFNTRVARAVVRQKMRKYGLDHGRRRPDPHDAYVATLQCSGALAQGLGLSQDPAAARQQILPG
jgi:hypothetical protein